MKDVLLALIAIATIMLYVEIRMSHFTFRGSEYRLANVGKVDDAGNKPLFMPLYEEIRNEKGTVSVARSGLTNQSSDGRPSK